LREKFASLVVNEEGFFENRHNCTTVRKRNIW